jgi:Cu/Ag efflux pump CusA
MAWAVIGGLVTSTMLTLVVIPCIYMAFGRLGEKRIKEEAAQGE